MKNDLSKIVGQRFAGVLAKVTEKNSELERGIEVEREHQDLYDHVKKIVPGFKMTPEEFFEWIARAHLREMRDYYTRLDRMESEAKAEK